MSASDRAITNPTNLFSLLPAEEAKRMVALAGGVDLLRGRAKKALADKDAQVVRPTLRPSAGDRPS